jgi:hypothetical protein
VAAVVQLKNLAREVGFRATGEARGAAEALAKLWARNAGGADGGGVPMMLITTVFDLQLRRQISFS